MDAETTKTNELAPLTADDRFNAKRKRCRYQIWVAQELAMRALADLDRKDAEIERLTERITELEPLPYWPSESEWSEGDE